MVKPLKTLCAEVAEVTTPYGGKRCQTRLPVCRSEVQPKREVK